MRAYVEVAWAASGDDLASRSVHHIVSWLSTKLALLCWFTYSLAY
jgi:hypothetical protein